MTERRDSEGARGSDAGHRLRRVSLAFDDKVILDGVSFTLPPGDMKIILGASGAGKSTILRLILGLLKPDGGADLRRRTPRRSDGRGAT